MPEKGCGDWSGVATIPIPADLSGDHGRSHGHVHRPGRRPDRDRLAAQKNKTFRDI